MIFSNFKCSCCQAVLNVNDNVVTATVTRDGIITPEDKETGKKILTIHWCELCADGLTNLKLIKEQAV